MPPVLAPLSTEQGVSRGKQAWQGESYPTPSSTPLHLTYAPPPNPGGGSGTQNSRGSSLLKNPESLYSVFHSESCKYDYLTPVEKLKTIFSRTRWTKKVILKFCQAFTLGGNF